MKVTEEDKANLERITRELEYELIRDGVVVEKLPIDDVDGEFIEVNALDAGGVSLLIQDPEYCEEIDSVEDYDDLEVSISVQFANWLSESQKDKMEVLFDKLLRKYGFLDALIYSSHTTGSEVHELTAYL